MGATKNLNTGYVDGKLLYEYVDELADKLLIKQKEFIFDSVNKEKVKDESNFYKLCNFEIDIKDKSSIVLRQDGLDDGILPLKGEKEIYLGNAIIDAYNSQNTTSQIDYDIISEYNEKIYLTQVLSYGHQNYPYFIEQLSNYFTNEENENNKNCVFTKAPVKLYDRCLIKATTDYSIEAYPSAACILDILRSSVVYNSIESLLNGLNRFVDDIHNGKIECISKIIRIKNGFTKILDWKSFSDAEYCDLKLNVVFTNRDKKSMIVEIQFLISSLLKAKKLGHKYSQRYNDLAF